MQVSVSQGNDGQDHDQSLNDRDDFHFEEAVFDSQSTKWLHNRLELLEDVGRQNDAIALENEFVME